MMDFLKVQGLGNDFVLLDWREKEKTEKSQAADWALLARRMCDRRWGIGADGLVVLLASHHADVRMRIFNPDGSEAEMCGNAIRCVARYVFERDAGKKRRITVETLAGPRQTEVVCDEGGNFRGVKVDMGVPVFEPARIPVFVAAEKVINWPREVGGKELYFTAVSMGNPHCVIFVSDVEQIPFYEWGPAIERHPLFPMRTNVEFVQVLGREEVRVRVWERGAGETLACGTGACAVAVAAFLNGYTERRVKVHLPGGELFIAWEEDGRVFMTGAAEEVFSGQWPD